MAPVAMIVRPLPSMEPLLQSSVPVIVTSPLPESVPPFSTKAPLHWLVLDTVSEPPESVKASRQRALFTESVPEEWVMVTEPGRSSTTSSAVPGSWLGDQLAATLQSPPAVFVH